MSHSLKSFKGVKKGTTIGLTKGDTRSLDYIAHTLLGCHAITPTRAYGTGALAGGLLSPMRNTKG